MLSPEEQFKELSKGVVQIEPSTEFLKKLQTSYETKKPLRVKAGFDPTRPDLHLGHVVLLNKMRQFQKLGHEVIFLIGDFTARIGDPTGQNETRPPLTETEIQQNAQTYAQQVFKLLDKDQTQIHYNSEWTSGFSTTDFIKLMGRYTLARIMERDDFKKRFQSGHSISLHEILYPLLQGYDSVALKSDIELGGTDQIFNLLVGRDLQKAYQQSPQCVLTLPLLEGTDGVLKMSKSYDNFIALEDTPQQMFGKILKISDTLMVKYYELLTDITVDELSDLKNRKKHFANENPKDTKIRLAKMLVTQFHSAHKADLAHQEFDRIFAKGGQPDDMPEITIPPGEIWICKLLLKASLVTSTSEARRLIRGQAVKKDGILLTDESQQLVLIAGDAFVLKAGKRRFAKILVQ